MANPEMCGAGIKDIDGLPIISCDLTFDGGST